MEPQPLKAIPEAFVEGKIITLTADKSEGDICAYGWGMSVGSPENAKVVFLPKTSVQGEKDKQKGKYISGTLVYIPIKALVKEPGEYVFALQVLDKDKKADWAEIKVTVE